MTTKLVVLTGAPGVGKTAILSRLDARIHRVGEPAREILAEHRAVGAMQPDPPQFVDLLLCRSIEKHEAAQRQGAAVVFDRGVPDCVAYARYSGVDAAACVAATGVYRYHPEVLIARPWEEIYTTDAERTMTFEMTVDFHGHVETAYKEAGYAIVEIPRSPLEDRVAFVADYLQGLGEPCL